MKKILILAAVSIIAMSSADMFAAPAGNETCPVIPYPNDFESVPGSHVLSGSLTYSCPRDFMPDMELMSDIFRSQFRISMKKGKNPVLKVDKDATLQKDEYRLSVSESSIDIAASTGESFFYAMQTLRQLVRLSGSGIYEIRNCRVEDRPAYRYRGFMLDEGRQFCGMDVVKTILDEMALLKMNVFHWHLTENQGWRIEIKKYPELTGKGAWRDSTTYRYLYPKGTKENPSMGEIRYTRPYPTGGYYTQAEIKEIVDYASARHILIVPEIEMPGHSRAAIASYPWLDASGDILDVPSNSRFEPYAMDVANPRVVQFAKDVIDEVAALFPGPVIHLGGDEIRYDSWKKSEYVMEAMKEKNYRSYSDIQTDFFNTMAAYLKTKGKRLMGWNEIMGDIHTAGNSSEKATDVTLDSTVIVQFWTRLHTEEGHSQRLVQALEKGHQIVNSDKRFTYFDFIHHYTPLSKVYSFSPVPEGLNEKEASKVLGLCCALWGQVIPTVKDVYEHTFPRITAIAEVGWTDSSNKDYGRFSKAVELMKRRWDTSGIYYYQESSLIDTSKGTNLKE